MPKMVFLLNMLDGFVNPAPDLTPAERYAAVGGVGVAGFLIGDLVSGGPTGVLLASAASGMAFYLTAHTLEGDAGVKIGGWFQRMRDRRRGRQT